MLTRYYEEIKDILRNNKIIQLDQFIGKNKIHSNRVYQNHTYLTLALEVKSNVEMITYLLNAGEDANQLMPDKLDSVLTYAFKNHPLVINVLLEFKANPNQPITVYHRVYPSLLSYCVINKKILLAKKLIDYQADPYITLDRNKCLLKIATESTEIIKIFTEEGIRFKQKGIDFLNAIPPDYQEAAACFQKSIDRKINADIELTSLVSHPHISSDALNAIGKMLLNQYQSPCHPLSSINTALMFLRAAYEKKNSQAAKNLGFIYENGIGLKKSIQSAMSYYQFAISYGLTEAEDDIKRIMSDQSQSRDNFKLCVRHYSVFKAKQHNYTFLNEQNNTGNTILHQCAKLKLKKDMAKLIYLGADPYIKNIYGKTPIDLLSYSEQGSVDVLQMQLSQLINQLNESIPQTISYRFIVKGANHISILSTLTQIEKNPLLCPLLKLAKFASLGLHNLAKREKFSTPDYDSDNDENEKINDSMRLSILIDATKPSIENISLQAEQKSTPSFKAHGEYSYKINKIFLGNITTQKTDYNYNTITTFIHELVHLACNELYDNECKPYKKMTPLLKKILISLFKQPELIRHKDFIIMTVCYFP